MDFADKLSAIVSKEAAEAHGDHDRMAALIEVLARSLGFSVAIAAQGVGKTIDLLLAGAESHAHEEAVAKSAFARFMSEVKSEARRMSND